MSVFQAPLIMGIMNLTQDSFFAESRFSDLNTIKRTADSMIESGADIIDIGGESTRPGSSGVSDKEQIDRIVPAIKAIREQQNTVDISIDTQSANVAEAALNAGATWINDISAMRKDSRMAALAAERSVPIVLMHMQGEPKTMQNQPRYKDVIREIREFFEHAVERALAAGIRKENIILDPGIGFGKRVQDNLVLLNRLPELRVDDLRLLVGLSRKSFLACILHDERKKIQQKNPQNTDSDEDKISAYPPHQRLAASISAAAWCLSKGVNILRVHDVRETREMIALWEALAWAS